MPKALKRKSNVVKLKTKKRQLKVIAQRVPQTIAEAVLFAARDPSIPVDKMRVIIETQQRIEFDDALVKTQKEIPLILKDATNPQTTSTYAKLETISRQVDPIIHENGFSLSYRMGESPVAGHYRIICKLSRNGHERDNPIDLPADDVGIKGNKNKTPTHAAASSITYARRLLKCMIFDIRIAGEDDDGNLASALPISTAQLATLNKVIDEVGANRDKIMSLLKIEKLADMPVAALGRTMVYLEQMRAAKK